MSMLWRAKKIKWEKYDFSLVIDRKAREIIRLHPSVRLSVRPSVIALTLEPFDLRP